MPVALVLGSSGDRAQMFLSGAILMLAGVLPFVHEKVNRALVDSLALRRERAVLTLELDDERSRSSRRTMPWPTRCSAA